jgi:hypothetical protein
MNVIIFLKNCLNTLVFYHKCAFVLAVNGCASMCGVGSPEAAQLEAKRYLLSLLARPRLQATIREWGMSLIVEIVEGLQ